MEMKIEIKPEIISLNVDRTEQKELKGYEFIEEVKQEKDLGIEYKEYVEEVTVYKKIENVEVKKEDNVEIKDGEYMEMKLKENMKIKHKDYVEEVQHENYVEIEYVEGMNPEEDMKIENEFPETAHDPLDESFQQNFGEVNTKTCDNFGSKPTHKSINSQIEKNISNGNSPINRENKNYIRYL